MNKRKKVALLIAYYAVPLVLVGSSYGIDTSLISDPLLGTALVSGVLGYSWLMMQLILSARLKVIERGIGHDRLLVFHRIMAPVSIMLLTIHLIVKVWLFPASLQVLGGLIVFFGFLLVGIVSVALFSDSRKKGLLGVLQKLAYEKFRLQYHQVKALHNSTFVLSVIMFLHVMGSSTAEYSLVLRLYFILLFVVAAAAYLYHKVVRPTLRAPVYEVVEIDQPARNVTNIGFELVKGVPVRHVPGQFAFYRFLNGVPGKEEHPFTISAGASMRPGEVRSSGSHEYSGTSKITKEYLSFTAKALGDFTEALPTVKIGDRLKVDGPYGVFSYYFISDDRPMVWIAGGIGITPFLSMARTRARTGATDSNGHGKRKESAHQKPLLVWNARQPEDFIYRDELAAATQLVQVLDNQEAEWDGRRGRISAEVLRELLSTDSIKDAVFFICGPPAMMLAVRQNLQQLGVSSGQMLWERFSL